ncbi:MAG: fatty acid desaturase [Symbiobacteriaceae bacterium]|jgi:fatty acid desaturase|nr:fatty acid desaturase [Symbiobacteriaceae bacterium]
MKEMHPIGWYAAQVAPHLPKQAFKPAPGRLWGGLVYLLMTAVGIAAIGLLDLHPLANAGLSLVVATGFAGMGFLAHEILHGTVVKTAWLRDLLGGIAFLQFGIGAKLWRKWHNMEHHAHTQEDHADPDAWATMEELYRRPALRWVYRLPNWVRATANFTSFLLFFTIHGALMYRRFIGEFKPKDRRIVRLQAVLPWVLWFSLLAWMGPAKWLFAYVLPLMMANFVVICYIATNHQLNPLTDVNDPLANSLTVTVPRWVNVLHMNFAYHTEHHLFPGMNPKWAPLVQAEIMKRWPDQYHAMPWLQALATLARTPRIYANKTDLVDPHRVVGYGTLGHGLDPAKVQGRPAVLADASDLPFGLQPQEGD